MLEHSILCSIGVSKEMDSLCVFRMSIQDLTRISHGIQAPIGDHAVGKVPLLQYHKHKVVKDCWFVRVDERESME